ncbi:hypothetical protein ACHAXR_000609 [Thalassiosira sp. AJA248-18]
METFATTTTAANDTTTSSSSSPIVELRQYQLHPSQTSLYTQRTIQSAPLRKNLPLAFFGFPETGGIPLNTAVHLYRYPGGHVERSEQRSALAKKDDWKKYLGEVKACMMQQSSGIFVEAGLVNDFDEIKGLEHWVEKTDGANNNESDNKNSNNKGIIELRKYQLKLGYDTVPKFLELYSEALPSKLNAAGTHPTTQLVTILVSDVGSLNTVYEVWKHGGDEINGQETSDAFCGMRAMEQSRQASRGATEWRKGIAEIAELAMTFDTTILKPLEFSPLR